jgi:hypothetical protein
MTFDEASEILLIAWEKDMPMWLLKQHVSEYCYLAYLNGETDDNLEKVAKEFPFMPANAWWYAPKQTVRRFIAAAFPKFNNRLWDAKDAKARRLLIPRIKFLKAGKVPLKTMMSHAESKALRYTQKRMATEISQYVLLKNQAEQSNNTEWHTVK